MLAVSTPREQWGPFPTDGCGGSKAVGQDVMLLKGVKCLVTAAT